MGGTLERKSRTMGQRSRSVKQCPCLDYHLFVSLLFADEEKRRRELKVIEEEPGDQ